ncbi:DNA recombination protein RmuC [Thiomicrorhabdus xiamenensis]|uniref:DNA recombination protein RmuC n=1 Tax=Thiomicrorhabdus xiamenensis TaxID=2739063 RepID=A0A7D4NXN6_9GAMM|nr:DNA recombination protein RmuC [Thiomicrorhabdus xiamenensis]QKI88658.1 DNA recombination protein RmuC [Thiomicrorhabdus xiamenensis]
MNINELFWPALTVAGFFILILGYLFIQQRQRIDALQNFREEVQPSLYELEALRQNQQKWQQDQLELEQQVRQLNAIQGQFGQLEQQLQTAQETLKDKERKLEALNQALAEEQARVATLETSLELQQKNAEEKLLFQQEAKQQLENEFKNLANHIFETKQQEFSRLNKESMGAILQPMQTTLESFKQRVETTHKESLEGRASLQQQLKQLQELNSQMTEETKNLTQALKGDSKTQGNWGELVLERLLERSGLREGEEFEREKSFSQQDGSRLRPDVILNLPGNKHIIIDSKVSLKHYEQTLNSDNVQHQQVALKSHLQSLRKHIDALASKRYDHLELLNAPDFVLMFIPVEGAYLMAIEAEPRIFEEAFDKRVAVVTPTTLFTTLKTIEQLWRYERQSENTVKLIKRAAEVHDKFVGFVESFEKVGKQLDAVNNSYHQAKTRMMEGNGNLVRQAEMLKELAGKTKKEIPEHLLQEAHGAPLLQDSD